jgi:hypothetical protein
LIDPGQDGSEAHIGFRQEIAFAIDGGRSWRSIGWIA